MAFKERAALRELKSNSEIIIKKADKGTTTVIMNKTDKIQGGQVQLDDRKNYMPLETPIVQETKQRIEEIINDLQQGNHIDTIMTKKWHGFLKHLAHHVYQFFTHSQRFTNQF